MTFGSLAALLGLALVDSLNPSALIATFYFLTKPAATVRVLSYLFGVFCTYLGVGILLMLGLSALWDVAGALENPIAYAAQGAIGTVMLFYGVVAPSEPKQKEVNRLTQSQGVVPILLLGMTVTAIELSTALPYIAAIGLLTAANVATHEWLPLLVIYNLIFVLPPLLLLVVAQHELLS